MTFHSLEVGGFLSTASSQIVDRKVVMHRLGKPFRGRNLGSDFPDLLTRIIIYKTFYRYK